MTETPTEAPGRTVPEPRRTSLSLTTRDMVVSMVVIVAAVGVLLLLVPRPNSVPTRTIDVAAAASGSAAQLGFTPSYPAAGTLGAGWNPTVADVQVDTDDRPTWHVDYVTPTGHYVGIQETRKATAAWESRQVTDGRVQGSVEIAGRSWLIRSRTDRGITSYVLRRPPLTTVVTGTATAEEMAEFTAAVMPPAAAPSASATP